MKYLIAGVSGSGKTTVRKLLEKRGYRCIDIDKEPGLTHWYNKKTGELGTYRPGIGSSWLNQHDWLWDEQKMQELLNQEPNKPVFVCGVTSDLLDRLDLFHKVFLLQIPAEIVRQRLTERPGEEEFGKGEDEIAHVLSWQEEWEKRMIEKGAIVIDATKPQENVVEEILSRRRVCASPPWE